MMDKELLSGDFLDAVKRHLKITWEDEDTDRELLDKMEDAEVTLNHIIGAEADYSKAGMERSLYMNYMLYAQNDCLEQFTDAYAKEIMRIRHIYKVRRELEHEE